MATRNFKLKCGQHYTSIGHVANERKEKAEKLHVQLLGANLISQNSVTQTQINTNEEKEI